MPLVWIEDNESRSAHIVRLGKKAEGSYTKSWKVFGSSDDYAVHAEVATNLGSIPYYTHPTQPTKKFWVDHYTLEYLGDDAWQVKATYIQEGAEDPDQEDPLKRSRSFDTTGGTSHMTQALAESRFGAGAPDMGKAIGVDGDSVSGVDVITPALQWTETYDVPSTFITDTYIRTLSRLTGSVNNATFRTFAAGEVLFTGASGSHEWDDQKGDGPWSLTYKFIASPNAGSGKTLPAITVGGITGIEKKGHEYLWVRYEDDVADNTLIKKPKYVYVNRVYREEDFSQLGLG